MNSFRVVLFLVLLVVSSIASGETMTPLLTCNMGYGHTVQLLGKHLTQQPGEYQPYFKINGELNQVLTDSDEFLTTGDMVFKKCTHQILIFVMSVGNGKKGAAIRYNNATEKFETIYYSERGIPQYIFTNDDSWGLAAPYIFQAKVVDNEYVIYSYQRKNNSNDKQDEISLSPNNFPSKSKYKIIKLYSGKPRW